MAVGMVFALRKGEGVAKDGVRKSGGIMDQTQAIWIKDPLAILADGAERGVVVRDGRIVELVPCRPRACDRNAAVFDARAHVVLPGLINTHHHFYQTLTRALPAAMDRELFPWLQALYPVWARLTPETLELGVTVAMSELLLSGCTTTTDHHYVFPAGLEEAVDIEVACRKAARHARAADARLDEPLAARRRPAAGQRGAGRGHHPRRQRARGEQASPARRGRDGADRAGAMLAVFGDDLADARRPPSLPTSSTSACTRIWPRPRTRTNSASRCMAAGRSTISNNAAGSMRGPGWRTASSSMPSEMKRLGKARTTISHCACSNQILASGCCPVCEMEEAGVAIGLGVDGSASNDESNLMQEVRAAFLLQRARYGVGRVSHKDALRWATKGSAACVGRPELGEIAVGKAADLALFKLDELRFSGHGDPLAALVLCGAHRADRVMVGGKVGGDRWRDPRPRRAGPDPPSQRRGAEMQAG